MSQFGLPNPNDNVLEERIEWDSILNQEQMRCCSILETKCGSCNTQEGE